MNRMQTMKIGIIGTDPVQKCAPKATTGKRHYSPFQLVQFVVNNTQPQHNTRLTSSTETRAARWILILTASKTRFKTAVLKTYTVRPAQTKDKHCRIQTIRQFRVAPATLYDYILFQQTKHLLKPISRLLYCVISTRSV